MSRFRRVWQNRNFDKEYLFDFETKTCDIATIAVMFLCFILFIFSFLFETFPNALTISWNISILTFIAYVSWSIVDDGQSSLIM